MLITLSNDELTTAVRQYLGDEYDVTGIKFVISRSAGNTTKAEVSATRAEVTPYQLPAEDLDSVPWNEDDLIDTEVVEKPSLFPNRGEDG